MDRILISGYYGFNNSGDEAILRLMIENLRARLDQIEITVFSHYPEDTAKRYGVRAVDRMSVPAILREIARCDLLISGGGSLLQDVTSQRSILYYLSIIRLAQLMGKKVFIYSQGIGPILSEKNRQRTARRLRKVDGIVVRDQQSRDLLVEMGVPGEGIHVTSDPVVRASRPGLARGLEILRQEGCPKQEGRLLVGWSMREKPGQAAFTGREEAAIRWLQEAWNADVVLLPFHRKEDMAVSRRMQQELGESVGYLKGNYLSQDLLSVVGNLDVLVGVRLHSLIYAAVMGVPMLGISYDPKIDSFLHSIGTEAVASAENFDLAQFQTRFTDLMEHREEFQNVTAAHLKELRKGLDVNEDLICQILGREPGGKRLAEHDTVH